MKLWSFLTVQPDNSLFCPFNIYSSIMDEEKNELSKCYECLASTLSAKLRLTEVSKCHGRNNNKHTRNVKCVFVCEKESKFIKQTMATSVKTATKN